ncbi:MAG: transposase [Bacilli bacterium]|nr:transposase [Bacilli bacterium]
MSYFSNAARGLKRAISDFLENHMFEGLSMPVRKFVADATYGLLKSGSPLVSEQARALCERARIAVTENRLCLNYSSLGLSQLASNVARFSLRELMDFPYQIDVDESDVVKPYGFAFEELGLVHDGSKEGRPREKGYHVTGVVGYCRNGTVAPLSLSLYSTSQDGYESLSHETEKGIMKAFDHIPDKSFATVTFDRGYDSHEYPDFLGMFGSFWVIRCKSERKWEVDGKKLSATEWASSRKGFYSFKFVGKEGEKVNAKATAAKASHPDLLKGKPVWLVAEYFPKESVPRVYMTNVDCHNKEGVKAALRAYRRRWPIEEFFRFAKQEFGLERFQIRSLTAINNFFLIAQVCCCFIGSVAAQKGSLYETCMDCWEGFGDDPEGSSDASKYGKAELRLYRVKRGIQVILSHTFGRPEIRKRARKPRPDQLTLF